LAIAGVEGTLNPCCQRLAHPQPTRQQPGDLLVGLSAEQRHRQHQPDHHPGGQQPLPLLGPARLGDHLVHLDAGYDGQPCRQVLAERGMVGQIATRGIPAPVQAGRRWVIERTHAWGNQDGKLRWCTQRRRLVVAFWLALASAALVCGRLLRRAWTCYRWDGRPRRRP
jgi:hypothetical protein